MPNNMLKVCVQAMYKVGTTWVQRHPFMNMAKLVRQSLCVNQGLVHGLYQTCTQVLAQPNHTPASLLGAKLYPLSTSLTKATAIYI
jgi:hypothetical protein